MKKIICYGDSNTFGYNTKDCSRFDENTRWTALLQKKLGTEYKVINEGMYDRTGFANSQKGDLFSAQIHFPKMLSKFDSIDILILAIGTNDLQTQYDINIDTIEKGLENLIKSAQQKAKNIIVIPAVVLSEKILEGFFNSLFDRTSIEKSKKLEKIYKKIADIYNCNYFDINKITKPSNIDGLHYDEKSHELIATKLADYINQKFENQSVS